MAAANIFGLPKWGIRKYFVHCLFGGLTEDDLEHLGKEMRVVYQTYTKKTVLDSILKQDGKLEVFVVTGSIYELVKPFADQYKFKVVSTTLEKELVSGKYIYTGNITSTFNVAQQKVLNIAQHYKKGEDTVLAYGNHNDDLPMLDLAETKYVVDPKPNSRLETLAQHHKWNIIRTTSTPEKSSSVTRVKTPHNNTETSVVFKNIGAGLWTLMYIHAIVSWYYRGVLYFYPFIIGYNLAWEFWGYFFSKRSYVSIAHQIRLLLWWTLDAIIWSIAFFYGNGHEGSVDELYDTKIRCVAWLLFWFVFNIVLTKATSETITVYFGCLPATTYPLFMAEFMSRFPTNFVIVPYFIGVSQLIADVLYFLSVRKYRALIYSGAPFIFGTNAYLVYSIYNRCEDFSSCIL